MSTYEKTRPFGSGQVEQGLSFTSPVVGTALTVAAGLSFQLLCMVLPIVGKAGMHPDREYAVRGLTGLPGAHGFDSYVGANRIAFMSVLLITLGLCVAAFASKLMRRRLDGSPFPRFSGVLLFLCAVLLVAHLTGTLAV